jgi:hypothetical protein
MSVDPSYMDFSGGDSSGYDPTSSWSSQYASTPAAPAPSDPTDPLSPISTSAALNQSKTNQLEAQHNINATDAASSPAPSALAGALSSLGGKQGSAVLSALTAILGAAGHMNTAKANATLPTMPGMGGPLAALPGQGGSTGYGPPGGYNWQNYKGITGATPGTGYAPRVQAPAAPLSSYYTYGQGPEQQFFQQVNPNGGQIAPVTHKRGGRVKKFAMGGPMMQRPVMPAAGGRPPMPRGPVMGAPMMGAPQMGAPVTGAPMMGPQHGMRPGARPFAAGGAPDRTGALSAPEQGSRYVQGPGDGTSDDIPARLANGEYVLSADVVSGLGNGDNSSGAKVLDGFVKNLRTHKAVNASRGRLPADAKPIHHYMKGGR